MNGLFKKKLKEDRDINIEEIEVASYDNGYNDGKSDGEYEMQIEIVKRLKNANISDEDIIKITDISPLVLKDLDL